MYALARTIMHTFAEEQHYRQAQHPSFSVSLTKFRHYFQRATILYVLTAHKDCRKLSIPFRRFADIFLIEEEEEKKEEERRKTMTTTRRIPCDDGSRILFIVSNTIGSDVGAAASH